MSRPCAFSFLFFGGLWGEILIFFFSTVVPQENARRVPDRQLAKRHWRSDMAD